MYSMFNNLYLFNNKGCIVPNKKAKRRKVERREKNEYLKKHGRTSAQIKKKKIRAEKRLNKIPQ